MAGAARAGLGACSLIARCAAGEVAALSSYLAAAGGPVKVVLPVTPAAAAGRGGASVDRPEAKGGAGERHVGGTCGGDGVHVLQVSATWQAQGEGEGWLEGHPPRQGVVC